MPADAAAEPAPIRAARNGLIAALLVPTAIAFAYILIGPPIYPLQVLTPVFFVRQDVLLMPLVLLFALQRLGSRPGRAHPIGTAAGWMPIAAAAVLVCFCRYGYQAFLSAFDLSRDEQMVGFDAAIFGHGRLFWPIPEFWRPFATALNLDFMLPVGDREGWVSSYLPVNAALHAVMALAGDLALTSPLLAATGAVALWHIAARLWPEEPSARVVALILYLGASQIVVTGMTAYAMSAHLALNLLWLALFLRGGGVAQAGAILVGFLATGLHQPLFHPLFVLPFLGLMTRQRRWRPLAAYLAAYSAIGLFWLAWPHWMCALGTAPVPAGQDPQGIGYGARLLLILSRLDGNTPWLMASNLVRFATWQHLLLLPLLALGLVAGRRDDLVRAMAIGLVLPAAVASIVLPWQGFGWGYRYLHGVEGNACLLAAGGWVWLTRRGVQPARLLAWSTAATVLVVLPVHLWMVARMVEPIAALHRRVDRLPADVAVVDDRATVFSGDLVLNRPDLSNRPIRLLGTALRPADMATLCRGRTLAFVDGPALAAFAPLVDAAPALAPSPEQQALQLAARDAGCAIAAP